MLKAFRFFRRGHRSVDMNETEGEKGLNCLIFDYLSLVFVMFIFSIFPMPDVYWHQTNVCYNSLFQKNIFFVY